MGHEAQGHPVAQHPGLAQAIEDRAGHAHPQPPPDRNGEMVIDECVHRVQAHRSGRGGGQGQRHAVSKSVPHIPVEQAGGVLRYRPRRQLLLD